MRLITRKSRKALIMASLTAAPLTQCASDCFCALRAGAFTRNASCIGLEEKLQHKLNVAWLAVADARRVATVPRPADQSASGEAGVRVAQIQPVEDVENLRTELNRVALRDLETLEDREVYRSEAGAVEAVALD